MPTVTLKRQSTDEANVSLCDVWYDIYVDGQYLTSRNDICDALDLKAELEQADTTGQKSEYAMSPGRCHWPAESLRWRLASIARSALLRVSQRSTRRRKR